MTLAESSSLSPAEAQALMMARLEHVGQERVALAMATGRVLAQPVLADRPSPAMDVSAMDGFAMRLADVSDQAIRIAGAIAAGDGPIDLPLHECVRIATGAPIPLDADVVIPIEHVREHGERITINPERAAGVKFGMHIRRKGENADEGACVLFPGAAIHAPAAAALASFGVTAPSVFRRVRVSVIITGDEVRSRATMPLRDWIVRDNNGPALTAMFSAYSWVELPEQLHVGDSPDALREPLERASRTADLVLVTGGVAVGHRDFVTQTLEAIGANTLFHGVAQRPGRPLLGAIRGACPILCLPGNPVSVLVTARRYALPVARALAGFSQAELPCELVRLFEPPMTAAPVARFLPVRRIAPGFVRALAMRGSGDAAGAAASNGFVEIPAGLSGEGPWNYFDWN